MNEKELDELLKEEPIDKSFQKKIKRKMNKNIYSRALITIIICCLVILVGYVSASKIVSSQHYNPNKEDVIGTEKMENNEFNILYYSIVNMNASSNLFAFSNNQYIEDCGFGKYKIPMYLSDPFEEYSPEWKYRNNFEPNYYLVIDKSQIFFEAISNGPTFTSFGDEFKDSTNKNEAIIENSPSEISLHDRIEMIKELPDSSLLDVSISFTEKTSLDEIASMIHQYNDIDFRWIALAKNTNQDDYGYRGISLTQDDEWGTDQLYYINYIDEKYNYFTLRQEEMEKLTGEMLQQKYLATLRFILDHPKFCKLLGDYNIELMNKLYENAQNELNAQGVRVYLKKKDLLKFLDENDVYYIRINNEKSSVFAK